MLILKYYQIAHASVVSALLWILYSTFYWLTTCVFEEHWLKLFDYNIQ